MHNIGMAPTIFRIWKFRVLIYPKDHAPAHVHIVGPDAEAKFDIETLECIESFGFSQKTLKQIKGYLEKRKGTLKEAWNEYQE